MCWGQVGRRRFEAISVMKLARSLQIAFAALALACCAQAKDVERPSLLPEIAKMEPDFACISDAPRDERLALAACFQQAGVASDKLANDPSSLSDFKQVILVSWLMSNRDPNRPLTAAALPRVIDYAKCVEKAAYADEAFSSRSAKGVQTAKIRSELACRDHPLSLRNLDLNGKDQPSDVAERLFANLLANSALTFALKQNGWFPDEMRPCIRYLDGRPPSAGCKGKLQGRPPIPPPPLP